MFSCVTEDTSIALYADDTKIWREIHCYNDHLILQNDIDKLFNIYEKITKSKIKDWLIKYEFLEKTNCNLNIPWIKTIFNDLQKLSLKNTDLSRAIKRSLKLFS